MLRLLSTTPNWWEDYPCLRQVSTEDVNVDLDVLQAGINLSGRGQFHCDRASRRVAMKRLYQRHPVNTLCQEGVRQCTGVMAAMLFLLLILYRIRSKRSRAQPDRIKTLNRAAVVRAIKVDREDCAKVKGGVMTYRKSSDHKAERNVVGAVKAYHSTNLSHCEGSSCSAKALANAETEVITLVAKGRAHLLVVIRQLLLMAGDVELNPGPLDVLDLKSITDELGSVMSKWFEIGVQLGINETNLQQIEANYSTVERCFSGMISFWLKGNTEVAVTWKSIIVVLESRFVNEKGLANQLREKAGMKFDNKRKTSLSTDHQSVVAEGSPPSIQKAETSNAQLASSVLSEVSMHHAERSSDAPQPKPKLTFPSLDFKKMSREEKEALHQRLYAESMDIMYKFQELFSSTTQSLKERNVSPRDLHTHLACLGPVKPTYDNPKQPVLRHYFPQIENAERIEEAMKVVSSYCSFFNYRIMEVIIAKLGTTVDKENLSNYEKDFSDYARRHVFECPSELGTMTDGNAEIFVTLDETYDDCTVSVLQLFVRKLAEVLKLSSDAALKLYWVKLGSLKLTFQVPMFVQEDIFPLSIDQKRDLAGLGVVHLSCGDYQFTNEDEELKLSSEAAVSEVTSLMPALTVDKSDGAESTADSMLEAQSVFSEATSTERLTSSHIQVTPVNGWLSVKLGVVGLSPWIWSKRWFVLNDRKLYYYKSPYDMSAEGVVDMSGYSIRPAPELKMKNVFKVLHTSAKTYYFQAGSRKEMTKWMQALSEAAELTSTHHAAESDVGLVSMATGVNTASDSAIGTLTVGTFTRSQVTTGLSQFSENIAGRDLRDERMECDAAKLQPLDDSSVLQLHQASRRGELGKVKQLIETQNVNPLQNNKYGDTALHYAAMGGDLDITKYLIEVQGLSPACQGRYGRTCLHRAAYFKHLELVKYLIGEQQVDPLCKDDDGYTSLHCACLGSDVAIVQCLINEIQKYMSLEDVLIERSKDGHTPFHLAAFRGHLPVIKVFLSEFKFDANTPGFRGRPALHYAAQEGHLEVVRYLIEEVKRDPSCCPGEDKATPLHMAAKKGRLDVVSYLTLQHHSSPLSRDIHGNTPLHYAALEGRFNVVEFFISELKYDANAPGQWGRSPLHCACQGGSMDIVKYLIEQMNCNPSQQDERQVTPLHIAALYGHLHLVKYLIQDKLCNPLCRSQYRNTPLHHAVRKGHLEVVQYYIETIRCSPNIRGWRNMTPLERARSKGHNHVVNYLESSSKKVISTFV